MFRISTAMVNRFDMEQKRYGTKTALHNIFWLMGLGLLKCAGVKVVKPS